MSVAAGWYSDPLGRHEYRYWAGGAWTEHVADRGVTSEDPLGAVSTVPVSASPVATPASTVPAPVLAPPLAQAPLAVGTAPPAVGGPRTEVQVAPRRAGIGMVLVRVAAALLIALGTIQALAVGTVGTRSQSTPFGETDGFADGFALARTNTSSSTTPGEGGTLSFWQVEYAGMGLVVLVALIAIIVLNPGGRGLVPRTMRSVRQRARRGEAPALVAEATAAGAGPHFDPRAIVGKASYRGRWIALLVLWLVVIGFTIYPITALEGPNFTVLPGGFVAIALGLAGLVATLLMTPSRQVPRLFIDPTGHLYPAERETEKVTP